MFVNLCSHQVDVYRKDGSVKSIQPSGTVARCNITNVLLNEIDGVPIYRQVLGEVQNLPEEIPGVLLIVSKIVAQACPNRHDLLVPGSISRDSNGNPKAAQGFSIMW
jgi:hypothetical protein